MSEDLCTTCNKPHPWPDGTTPVHPFNNGSLPMSATFGKPRADGPRGSSAPASDATVQEAVWPFDPVLRTALINKGIITPDDLSAAERHIRVVSGMVLGGQHGQESST